MDFFKTISGVNATSEVSEICSLHSFKVLDHLAMGHAWAFKMIDAWSKIPVSVLDGNLIDFGNYEECLGVKVTEEWGTFVGQHCMAVFDFPLRWLTNTKENDIKLALSMCIPSTCSPEEIKYFLSSKYQTDFILSKDMCHSHEINNPFQPADIIAIVVLTVLGLACFLGTAHNLIVKKPERRNKIMMLFSYYKNGHNLLGTKINTGPMDVLHGIRAISIMLVAVGYTYTTSAIYPQVNALKVADFNKDGKQLFVVAAFYAVDILFLLSGLLVSYSYMESFDSGKLKLFYLRGFLRMSPALAVMVLLETSLVSRIGDGLVWDLKMNDMKTRCQHYWWSTLLYIQNYFNVGDMCVEWSWFLAVQMQLYWLSPFILLTLQKKPKYGIALIIASEYLIFQCVEWSWFLAVQMQLYWLSPFILLTLQKKPKYGIALIIATCVGGTALSFQQTHSHHKINGDSSYIFQTHMRLVPWFMGLGFGYFLCRTKEWRKKLVTGSVNLSIVVVACAWLLTAAVSMGMFTWVNYLQRDYSSAAYASLCPVVWSFVVLWVIFACDSGYGGILNTMLTWAAFQPISRLTNCIYLIFPEVCTVMLALMRLPGYYDDRYLMFQFSEAYVVTLILSIVVNLTVEAPFVGLEKLLHSKWTVPKCEIDEKPLKDIEKANSILFVDNLRTLPLHED